MKRLSVVLLALALAGCSVEQDAQTNKVQMKMAGAPVGGEVSQAVCAAIVGFMGSTAGTGIGSAVVGPQGNVSSTTKGGYILLSGLGGTVLGTLLGAYVCT